MDWQTFQANTKKLPNPIAYTYIKDKKYEDENEFRVSLSALGVGQPVLNNGQRMDFPPHLHCGFDFLAAGAIHEMLVPPDLNRECLEAEMQSLRIRWEMETGQ